MLIKANKESPASNRKRFKFMLKRIDVSAPGLGGFLDPTVILEGVQKSSINTFGHKINIFADAEMSSAYFWATDVTVRSGRKHLKVVVNYKFCQYLMMIIIIHLV